MNSNKVTLGVGIFIVLLVAIAAFVFANDSPTDTQTEVSSEPATDSTAAASALPQAAATSSTTSQSATVTYASSGFSPTTLTIKAGTTVVFENRNGGPMWPASDPHPLHTDFSAFDAGKNVDRYEFTFEKPGTYGFHNHSRSSHEGVIVVE